MKKKAFTLVELLVVISIIAVLLAVLMPSLNKAKEMARTLICETHLKSLGTSWFAYTTDNDGWLVSAATFKNDCSPTEDSLRYSYSRYAWVWVPYKKVEDVAVGNRVQPTLEEEFEGIKRGALYKYSQDVGVYNCPSASRYGFVKYRNYSIADSMNGEQNYMKGTSYEKPWDSLTKIGQVRRPAEKYNILEEDDDSRSYLEGTWLATLNPTGIPNSSDTLSIRHSGTSRNCWSFADGHAEQKKWSNEIHDVFAKINKAHGVVGFNHGFTVTTDEGKADMTWLINGWAKKGF